MNDLDHLVYRYQNWLTRRLSPGVKSELWRGRRVLASARLHGLEAEMWKRLRKECEGEMLVDLFVSRHILIQSERNLVWANLPRRRWLAREMGDVMEEARQAGLFEPVRAQIVEYCPTPIKQSFNTYDEAATAAAEGFAHAPDSMPTGMYPCPGLHSMIHLSSHRGDGSRSVYGYLRQRRETA